jgi:hypothetical protein
MMPKMGFPAKNRHFAYSSFSCIFKDRGERKKTRFSRLVFLAMSSFTSRIEKRKERNRGKPSR